MPSLAPELFEQFLLRAARSRSSAQISLKMRNAISSARISSAVERQRRRGGRRPNCHALHGAPADVGEEHRRADERDVLHHGVRELEPSRQVRGGDADPEERRRDVDHEPADRGEHHPTEQRRGRGPPRPVVRRAASRPGDGVGPSGTRAVCEDSTAHELRPATRPATRSPAPPAARPVRGASARHGAAAPARPRPRARRSTSCSSESPTCTASLRRDAGQRERGFEDRCARASAPRPPPRSGPRRAPPRARRRASTAGSETSQLLTTTSAQAATRAAPRAPRRIGVGARSAASPASPRSSCAIEQLRRDRAGSASRSTSAHRRRSSASVTASRPSWWCAR